MISCNTESCDNNLDIATMNYYKRFTGTKELLRVDTMKYTFSYLTDTTILMKVFPNDNSKKITTTIDCINDDQDNYKLDSLNYRPFYFHFGNYCIPRVAAVKEHWNENEYYSYEYEKNYFIENDSMRIITFYRDCDDFDCDFRIYFNDKIGYLAGYSPSWGNAVICWNLNDIEKNKLRGLIIEQLLNDSTFFPYPKAIYVPPPPPPRPSAHEKYWPDSLTEDEIMEIEKELKK